MNQLNPGKIAAPGDSRLLTIDGVPTKGQSDRTIPPAVRAGFDEALHCNGNGACYNWDPDDPMCPSWKGTRERRHSPKGRAQLIREWLRQLAAQGFDPLQESRRLRSASSWRDFPTRLRNTIARRRGELDFSHAVKEALDGCLACKSCTGQCPIKVDVPSFRSKFFELYYGRYLRPIRDYAVGSVEHLAPLTSRMPRLHNTLTGSTLGRTALRAIGLVASPKLSEVDVAAELERRGIMTATPEALGALSARERADSVVLVQDAFTRFYEAPLVLDLVDLAVALGIRPWLAPFRPNGKPLHVHGFLGPFARIAARNATMLRDLAATGVDLVGLDPSMTLTYRSEYPSALEAEPGAEGSFASGVAGQASRSAARCRAGRRVPAATPLHRAYHGSRRCVGLGRGLRRHGPQAHDPAVGLLRHGGNLRPRGRTSRYFGAHLWPKLGASSGGDRYQGTLLATGYSCRSQVKLVDGVELRHPVQAILGAVREPAKYWGKAQGYPA